MKGRLSDVAAATAGRLAGEDAAFSGVGIDSRTMRRSSGSDVRDSSVTGPRSVSQT